MSAWRLGERPPRWLLKEFSKALELMGKNRHMGHTFNVGNGLSFAVLLFPTAKENELVDRLAKFYEGLR